MKTRYSRVRRAVPAVLVTSAALVLASAASDPITAVALPSGSLAVVQSVSPDRIHVGDVVTLPLLGDVVARRVVASDDIAEGRLLTLQADASSAIEPTGAMFVDRAPIVRAAIPYAGYVIAFLLENAR